ncbi:hypothetical protein AB0892_01010 [Streptomyces sp. NPDC005409]|uniref:hypothetical protein n=1 Tax=Streptomyces sp. NPDC005409 TaxID=3155342 RepID=UPI003456A9C9
MTQRLDPGAGWYGEFLRRDPQGVRACLDGAAMPPWDVVESLLRDLAVARGAEFAARESAHAARLRAAAVTMWDRLPGGEAELRTLLAASASQRAECERALRSLTARLGTTTDRAEADALARELSWTQDDATRATARHEDLTSRLKTLQAAPLTPPPSPQPPPTGRTNPAPPPPPHTGPAEAQAAPEPWAGRGEVGSVPRVSAGRAAYDGESGWGGGGGAGDAGPVVAAEGPVGRAEGRWLRGGRRAGGARYAGSAAPAAPAFTAPPGHPGGTGPEPGSEPGGLPAPRGARFGSPQDSAPRGARFGSPQDPAPRGARFGRREGRGAGSAAPGVRGGRPGPVSAEPPAGVGERPGSPRGGGERRAEDLAAELLALRAQGLSGEAHALLCEAAAWPAGRLPALAAELARAGLAADWDTLLWEAASLPPGHLAATAAALGDAGRQADCDRLLRQGAARPAAEVAAAALALDGAGRSREAEALLGAFVRVRTAEEAAGLARRDPQWFAPRLLSAARALAGSHHRDLAHALRVAGLVTP